MRAIARTLGTLALAGWLAACSTAPPTGDARNVMVEQASATLRDMTREDPSLDEMVRKSYGYALFPEVTKGGLVFGGAYGRGVVYEQGQLAGYADLTAGSFGLQIGGQSYSELILFADKVALDRFKGGPIDIAADATAVILTTGAAANARYDEGIVVIIRPVAGAMAEASVGAQQVKFSPR